MSISNFVLDRKSTGLLIVDVQEKLFPLVDRSCDVFYNLEKIVKGFKILNLPIEVSEQYPQGLGRTIQPLQDLLGEKQTYSSKTSFSCFGDEAIYKRLRQQTSITQWVIVGIEAHVCVLQTVRDFLRAGLEVVVLNDAITSRSIFDFSTAIAEMRDCGARISSTETVLFELLHDSKAIEFKQISALIKGETSSSCCNTCPC